MSLAAADSVSVFCGVFKNESIFFSSALAVVSGAGGGGGGATTEGSILSFSWWLEVSDCNAKVLIFFSVSLVNTESESDWLSL